MSIRFRPCRTGKVGFQGRDLLNASGRPKDKISDPGDRGTTSDIARADDQTKGPQRLNDKPLGLQQSRGVRHLRCILLFLAIEDIDRGKS